MEIKNKTFLELKRIDQDYKALKLKGILVPLISLVFAACVWIYSQIEISNSRKYVYVLENGKSLMLAYREGLQENRPAELRHHVKMLIHGLFTVTPDRSSVEENLKVVEYLGDESVLKFINNLRENKYYEKLIASTTTSKAIFGNEAAGEDSTNIQLDMSKYPFPITVKFQQQLVRSTMISIRELTFTMQARNTAKSDNNPHGVIIERFVPVSNTLINEYERPN